MFADDFADSEGGVSDSSLLDYIMDQHQHQRQLHPHQRHLQTANFSEGSAAASEGGGNGTIFDNGGGGGNATSDNNATAPAPTLAPTIPSNSSDSDLTDSELIGGDVMDLVNTTSKTAGQTDSDVLRLTCKLYGSIFAILFVLFLLVRNWKPHIYNLKKTYKKLNTPVADEFWGPVSWMWKVFGISYHTISEECGMDAATTIRLFEFGVKLSLIGILNSFFLMPIYKYKGDVPFVPEDPVREISLSHLSKGSNATVATAFAAYIIFGSAMYMIDKDFEWFTGLRHRFLSKKRAQNFSIFLSSLPEDMCTDEAIQQYFRSFSGDDVVIDGDVALVIPKLEAKVVQRDALVKAFEHKINILTVKGETPTHKTKMCGGEKVESIPTMTEKLDELNKEISEEIDRLETLKEERGREGAGDLEHLVTAALSGDGDSTSVDGGQEEAAEADDSADGQEKPTDALLANEEEGTEEKQKRKSSIVSQASVVSEKISTKIATFLAGDDDGKARNAAFVTLKDLASTNLARQAVHSHEPWECVPAEPPNPDRVNWKNVGKGNQKRKIGELVSSFLTTMLCIFWTIPVSFIASLSNVEGLVSTFPFLAEPVEKYDWFATLLAQLAPLILTVFISLLPHILLFFVKFELLIEIESMQHPSLFSKLAAFTIIQTFFISTISGTIFKSADAFQTLVTNPVDAIAVIAASLPAQSAYFIQLMMVQNLLAMGLELLRVSPVVQDLARRVLIKCIGYDLTEKERSSSFLLRAMSDPLEYFYGRELGAKTILVVMVLYVYSCMAPITCYFTLLVFLILAVSFRNQFIYIYPIANDSGGKLWINFTKISIGCMIIAQLVLVIVLLLGENWPAAGMMLPLFIGTIIFDKYFKQRHYLVTSYLPAGNCVEADRAHQSEGISYEWLNDQYLQPAMKQRVKYPSNYKEIAPKGWVDPNGEEEESEQEGGEQPQQELRQQQEEETIDQSAEEAVKKTGADAAYGDSDFNDSLDAAGCCRELRNE